MLSQLPDIDRQNGLAQPAHDGVLDSLPYPVLVIDDKGCIRYANAAAEGFFDLGAAILERHKISDLVPFDSPLMSPIREARGRAAAVYEYDIEYKSPRSGTHVIDVMAGPIPTQPSDVLVTLVTRGKAGQLTRQMTHQGAARSVRGMASVLAHEIKNPLLGIRGAAQLLESDLDDDGKALASLIRDEADRIRDLVDRMEVFSDSRPMEFAPLNIHAVLGRVREIASASFARHVTFREDYDPSLPEIAGQRDKLIQAFLNLVSNAVDAVPAEGGVITLTTAYRPGLKLSLPGAPSRQTTLPLEICVIDNGAGIAPDLMGYLFDPFVTTKPKGTGLGLALVAKIVGDHGGVIDCRSEPKNTVFRVLLPTRSTTTR